MIYSNIALWESALGGSIMCRIQMVLFMLCDPLSGYTLDTILDGDPGRAGRDVLPPP